jgi:catechol 2,3-dioxygenase-like lactoylglutathione lyase family enzyme
MSVVSVRYIVTDLDAGLAFYTTFLGFKVEMRPAPTFAMLSREDLRLLLSVPSELGGGGQSMPDGRRPEPGGWNRFQLVVSDLAGVMEALRNAGVRFRSDLIRGIGGNQVLLEDPAGNPIELFEPAARP